MPDMPHLGLQGHLGRFINHSCEPNCRTEFWRVAGDELAIGLFADKDIPADSELTFDYNFERYGDKVGRQLALTTVTLSKAWCPGYAHDRNFTAVTACPQWCTAACDPACMSSAGTVSIMAQTADGSSGID